MKKSSVHLKIISTMCAFVLIVAVIFTFLLVEPAVKIHGFESLSKDKLSQIQRSIEVFDVDGVDLSGEMVISNKIFVPISEVNKYTMDAFVSIEDTRFFNHIGVDYYRIGGSAVKNVASGSFKEGASTITQQLVKNTHLTNEKKMRRKINEMRIAVDVERHYSKLEILEMYLNILNFGNNVFGIGAAAKIYFSKPASQLTLNESALLAAIINNPSRYNPVTNPKNANQRRALVLKSMKKYNRITKEEFNSNIGQDISVDGVFFDQYANFLVSDAIEIMGSSKQDLFSQNYKIKTYLNTGLQKKLNNLVNRYEFKGKDNAIIHAVVMTSDGEVVANAASTGGDLSGLYRQPGSVIKPAISYAPAFEKRLISPLTPILDQPTDFKGYSPKNHKNRNLGWISVTEALKQSQNIPAVKLTDMCGVQYSKEIAGRLGFEFTSKDNNLAIALGGMSRGAKLTQIANCYQAFANGGEFIKCSHIDSITAPDGTVVYKREKTARRAVSAETAYFINEILLSCSKEGTARRIGNIKAAAKTGTVGTSEGNSDTYTVAYNKDYVVAVWIGAKQGLLPNTVNGGTHPCVLAKNILELLGADKADTAGFKKPGSIVSVDLNKDEYIKNHRMVLADEDSYKKDKITGNFSYFNMPKKYNTKNNYVLQTDDIDFDNFVIVDN